jgi:hypothetical protein
MVCFMGLRHKARPPVIGEEHQPLGDSVVITAPVQRVLLEMI